MDSQQNNDENSEGRNIEYSRSNSNQEFHNPEARQTSDVDGDDQNEDDNQEIDVRDGGAGDQPGRSSTGGAYSAEERKEKFTDKNYGGTGQYTRKDIENLEPGDTI